MTNGYLLLAAIVFTILLLERGCWLATLFVARSARQVV
jgi:hypothetical protein